MHPLSSMIVALYARYCGFELKLKANSNPTLILEADAGAGLFQSLMKGQGGWGPPPYMRGLA